MTDSRQDSAPTDVAAGVVADGAAPVPDVAVADAPEDTPAATAATTAATQDTTALASGSSSLRASSGRVMKPKTKKGRPGSAIHALFTEKEPDWYNWFEVHPL